MKKRVIFGLLLVVGCGGAQKPGASGAGGDLGAEGTPAKIDRTLSKEASDDFASAVAFFNQQAAGGWTKAKCSAAAERFKDVASSHAKMVEARFNAGVSFHSCKDLDKAESQYEEALKINPKHGGALSNLGSISFARGNETQAKQYWERAVQADAKVAGGRANLAMLAVRDMRKSEPKSEEWKRLDKEASEQLSRVLAVENENLEAHVIYAQLHLEGSKANKSRLALAKIFLDKAEKIEANYPPLHNARGLLLLAQESVAPALGSFRRAAELDPKFVEAKMNVGNIVLDFRKYDEAEVQFRQVLEIQPRNYDALVGLGIAQRGLSKFDEAEVSYKEAVKVNNARPEAYFNLGVIYQDFRAAKTEDINQSKQAYQQAIGFFRDASRKAAPTSAVRRDADENIKVCEKNLKLM